MPTTRPRYTVTDTGSVQRLLDDAQRRWPDITSRKQLLLMLAQAGRESILVGEAEIESRRARERQHAALAHLQRTVDWSAIKDDQAWR